MFLVSCFGGRRQGHFWSSVKSPARGHLDLRRTGYELQTRLSKVDCSQASSDDSWPLIFHFAKKNFSRR